MQGMWEGEGDDDLIADSPNGLITYRGEIPPEIHDALVPLLEKYKCLIPAWCHRINVSYWDKPPEKSEGASADSTCYYEYRWASIRTFPSFFSSKEDQREEYVVHEMIHVSVNPLYDYACCAIRKLFESDLLKGNTALLDLILMELKDRNESITTDLQKIVNQLIEEKEMSFKKAQQQIEKKQGVSKKEAGAELASATRNASAAAKAKNPNLKKVK